MDLEKAARKKAFRTPCKFRVSAICLDKRGRVLGIASNLPRLSKKGGGIHAEMAALQKWGVSIDKIMLLRFGGGGDLLPIDPCENCKRILAKLKISVIKFNPR